MERDDGVGEEVGGGRVGGGKGMGEGSGGIGI